MKISYSKIKIVRMIPGSTTGNFYGVYMEMFKTKLGKKNFKFLYQMYDEIFRSFQGCRSKTPKANMIQAQLEP